MTLIDLRILAVALAVALMAAGCGKPPADTQAVAVDSPAAATAENQQRASAAQPAARTAGTNGAGASSATGAAAFMAKSLASPFASADQDLKQTFDRALIAFQIGDYARAAVELYDLAGTPGLNAQQQQAIEDLWNQTQKLAPEVFNTNTVTVAAAGPGSDAPAQFPLVATDPASPANRLPENPFSTADPAVQETFARAKAAFDIGNYDAALTELRDLVTNPQLNFQQKYAVQSMLDKTPQAAPAKPPGETPKR
jgi:hypothetical protein